MLRIKLRSSCRDWSCRQPANNIAHTKNNKNVRQRTSEIKIAMSWPILKVKTSFWRFFVVFIRHSLTLHRTVSNVADQIPGSFVEYFLFISDAIVNHFCWFLTLLSEVVYDQISSYFACAGYHITVQYFKKLLQKYNLVKKNLLI